MTTNGKPTVVKACNNDYEITGIDKNGETQIIQQRACTDPEEMLGVFMSPLDDGKQTVQEATNLTKKQCDAIMSPLLKIGLRASGIQWRISRKVLYGSPEALGLGFPNLFTTLHVRKIAHLVNFGNVNHFSGELISLSYQATLLELGLPGDLFDWDFKDWGHLVTPTWITHLWDFCSNHRIRIKSNSAPGYIFPRLFPTPVFTRPLV